MKSSRSTNIILATGAALVVLASIVIALRAQAGRDSTEIAASFSATTGELAALYLSVSGIGQDRGYEAKELKDLVRRQSMILITLNLDVSEFDSAGFEGICRLASNRDSLFPISQEQNVEALSNRLLNSRFASLAPGILKETLARSNRVGDRHSCPGFSIRST